MLFNSFVFILAFLPLSLGIYFLLNTFRLTLAAKASLLFSSLFFFSYWNIRYLPLLLGSIFFNYIIGGLLIEYDSLKRKVFTKRQIFLGGIIGNILLLSYYKYMDFFIGNLNFLLGKNLPLQHIVLPLGISFFTITQIAFLVDAYEGLVEERNLLNYSLFVTFFPHLLAGPILHHKEMMPQFDLVRNKVFSYKNFSKGFFLFFIGIFKKVIIADYLAKHARTGFDATTTLNLVEAWVVSLSYTLQLYFDFSGYTDMAIGVGLMFNIQLPVNFNSPYKAKGIIEFWKRWHMTLTAFVNTYLYSVMVRSLKRVTFNKSMIAIFGAMFISGVWHGAGWTFILWGAMHGLALVINHVWKSKVKIKVAPILSWFITFNFVNMAFVFFRAKSVERALEILQGMIGINGITLPLSLENRLHVLKTAGVRFGPFLDALNAERTILPILAVLLAFVLITRNSNERVENFSPDWRHVVFTSAMVVVGGLNLTKLSEFLYFNF